MITAVANSSFVAYSTGAPTGLAGTIGVRILDVLDNEVVARSTDNITEILPGSGVYKWVCAGLASPGSYLIVWDTNGGAPAYTEEELTVTAPPMTPQAALSAARPSPSLNGFADAQDQKRGLLGSDVTFLQAAQVTFPPGTPINPDTSEPYDPTIEPAASAQASAVVRCGVYFRALVRGSGGEAAAGAAGWEEVTRIFAIAPYAARPQIEGSVELIFHEDRFKIHTIKVDELVTGYRRMLVYAAAT